jgi:hypothetical protein
VERREGRKGGRWERGIILLRPIDRHTEAYVYTGHTLLIDRPSSPNADICLLET